jgi:diguanylate cyclase (GGDEF)-like protein
VLKGAVRFMRANLRPYDRVFRYGGEEFLVLMPDTDAETGRLAIERLRAGLADDNVAHDGPTAIRVTASFGLAMVDPDAAIEESMDRADRMMYAAKTAGRNCLRVWPDAGGASPRSDA